MPQVTRDNLGGDYPMLAGNLTSIFSSGIICTIISLIKPQNYDWKSTREIPTVDDDGTHSLVEFGEWDMSADAIADHMHVGQAMIVGKLQRRWCRLKSLVGIGECRVETGDSLW
jgi:hypothetical protein